MVNVRCPMTAIYYVVCNSDCLLFPKESKFGESMSSYKTGTCHEHSSGEKYLKIIIHQKEKGWSQVQILLVNTAPRINALC
jgi:hypothetical protein